MTDPWVYADARVVYNVYCDAITKRGGKYTEGFEKERKLWQKIAKIAQNQDYDLKRFAEAPVKHLAHDEVKKATPSRVYNRINISQIYLEADGVIQNSQYFRDLYTMFNKRLADAVKHLVPSVMKSSDDILKSPHSSYEPWFRIVKVETLTDDMIMAYGKAAIDEYNQLGLRSFLNDGEHASECERLRTVQQALSGATTSAHIQR